MIVVSMPQKREEVKTFIDGLTIDDYTFKVEGIMGLNINVSEINGKEQESFRLLKSAISKHIGPAYFFGVSVK